MRSLAVDSMIASASPEKSDTSIPLLKPDFWVLGMPFIRSFIISRYSLSGSSSTKSPLAEPSIELPVLWTAGLLKPVAGGLRTFPEFFELFDGGLIWLMVAILPLLLWFELLRVRGFWTLAGIATLPLPPELGRALLLNRRYFELELSSTERKLPSFE